MREYTALSANLSPLAYIFSDGVDDIETVNKNIKEMNKWNSAQIMRLTGDIIVDNMNKFLKKFIRYERIYEGRTED